jgi:hypothetical protein
LARIEEEDADRLCDDHEAEQQTERQADQPEKALAVLGRRALVRDLPAGAAQVAPQASAPANGTTASATRLVKWIATGGPPWQAQGTSA